MLEFKKINKPLAEIPKIEEYNKNKRFNITQFQKYFSLWNNIDNYFYGLYDNDTLVALSYLIYNQLGIEETYIAEVQCMIPGKEYGKKLIQNIIDNTNNLYLLSDPLSKDLVSFYSSNFKSLSIYMIPKHISVYNTDTNLFYKCEQKNINKFMNHFLVYKKDFFKH